MIPSTITATTYFANNIMIRRQIPLARAVILISHASAVVPPDADLLEVHSPSRVVLVPVQIIFYVNRAFVPRIHQPTRRGLYQRDRGICAYCGKHVPFPETSMDHVVPQAVGGPTCWENLVNACRRCNERKADRTPAQARMPLLFKPYMPRAHLRPDESALSFA